MLILAITTSQMSGGIALVQDGAVVAEVAISSRKTHSRRLMSQIIWLLQESDLGWKDLEAVAVDQGPGSFTGLRIGISTAKGLAVSLGIPVVGIGALDVMAVVAGRFSGMVCPMVDARRGQIYAALYLESQVSEEGGTLLGMKRGFGPAAVTPEELLLELARLVESSGATSLLVTGDGFAAHSDVLEEGLRGLGLHQVEITSRGLWRVQPALLGLLAHEGLTSGRIEAVPPHELLPIYCRLSEAEENLARRMKEERPRT